MIRLNLFYMAILVLGLNIWTTNDNALYTAGLGLANIFNKKKETDGSDLRCHRNTAFCMAVLQFL